MKNKLLWTLLILIIFSTSAYADVFQAKEQYNSFNADLYMYECGFTNDSQTSSLCKLSANSDEFKKRLELINWYADFDILMRQRIFSEILWDLDYDEITYMYDWTITYHWSDQAYDRLSLYTNSYKQRWNDYLRNPNMNENEFREGIANNLYGTIDYIESLAIWFNNINQQRDNLIKANLIKNDESFQTIYLWNINEIEKLFKENYYTYLNVGDKNLYDSIYFPNVKKFLNIEKEWTSFYRDFKNFDNQDYVDLWYSQSETNKWLKGDYSNTYEKKVNFDFEINQNIWKNILTNNSIDENNSKVKKTKLEEYAVLWWKDITVDYKIVEKAVVNYFSKYKAKNWITQVMINEKINTFKEKIPSIIISYEKKYDLTTINSKKELYKKYIWLFLIFEKVLNEHKF